MNPQPSPSDDEIAHLLASRLKTTTPEFEARWVDLTRSLRTSTPHRRPAWLLPGLALAIAGAAALAVVTMRPRAGQPPINQAELDELGSLEAALAPGAALLDPENREALLHLPADPKHGG